MLDVYLEAIRENLFLLALRFLFIYTTSQWSFRATKTVKYPRWFNTCVGSIRWPLQCSRYRR